MRISKSEEYRTTNTRLTVCDGRLVEAGFWGTEILRNPSASTAEKISYLRNVQRELGEILEAYDTYVKTSSNK